MSSKTSRVPPAGLRRGGADAGKHVYGTGKSKSACIGAEINTETEEEKRLISVGRSVYRIRWFRQELALRHERQSKCTERIIASGRLDKNDKYAVAGYGDLV